MAKAKQTPSPRVTPVSVVDFKEADIALAEMASNKAEVDAATADAERRILEIKEGLKRRAEPLLSRNAALLAGVERFARQQKKRLFSEERSHKLTHGVIGFRLSKELQLSDDTLKLLHRYKLEEAIDVKESVKKAVLDTFTEAALKKVGVTRVETDHFFCKLLEKPIQNTQAEPRQGRRKAA